MAQRPIKILFIDDDDDLFVIYNRLLKSKVKDNFTFEHINTATKIEETVQNNSYDIIILDQKLDNGNRGTDFLPIIKKNNLYAYVIINSAYGNEELAIEAIRQGANDYIIGNKENNDEFLKIVKKNIEAVKNQRILDDIYSIAINKEIKMEEKLNVKINQIKKKHGLMDK